jgi:hypothetical protein
MTLKKTSVTKHLSHAKHDIAKGTASFRSAANHIAAAIKAGATQAEAAAKVGKSQPWVNRLLKWKENGFKEGGPFADDHARAIISAANNPPEQTRRVFISGAAPPETRTLAVPYYPMKVPEPEPKVVRLQITRESKAPVDYSEEVAAAMPVLEKLARLEQVATELITEIKIQGGIVGAGKDVECRIMEVANKLWTSAAHPPVRRFN